MGRACFRYPDFLGASTRGVQGERGIQFQVLPPMVSPRFEPMPLSESLWSSAEEDAPGFLISRHVALCQRNGRRSVAWGHSGACHCSPDPTGPTTAHLDRVQPGAESASGSQLPPIDLWALFPSGHTSAPRRARSRTHQAGTWSGVRDSRRRRRQRHRLKSPRTS
jgi:hypothetical protein